MSACAMQTYNNVTRAAFNCVKQAAQDQYHVSITTDAGCTTESGFTVCWNYNENAQTASIQCTDSPWWAPCSTINSKINDVVGPCLQQHGLTMTAML